MGCKVGGYSARNTSLSVPPSERVGTLWAERAGNLVLSLVETRQKGVEFTFQLAKRNLCPFKTEKLFAFDTRKLSCTTKLTATLRLVAAYVAIPPNVKPPRSKRVLHTVSRAVNQATDGMNGL